MCLKVKKDDAILSFTLKLYNFSYRLTVLEPEYLASPWLDELSGMTYLSYFLKPDGPGYNASMRWVNSQIKVAVSNFTVKLVCNLL